MTDTTDPTVQRLQAGLNTAAASIDVGSGLRTTVDTKRQRRARRRRTGAAIAAAGALSVCAAVGLTVPSPSGAAKVVVGAPTTAATGTTAARGPREAAAIGPPWWLPAPGSVRRIEVNNNTTAPAYQQLYLGSGSLDPAELLIVTVDARGGRPSPAYIHGRVRGETTVQVGSATAHLANVGGAEQLWWTEPDGVQVIASETGLTPAQFAELMSTATPARGSLLGIELPGALPAGLAPARAAMSTHTGWVEDVQIAVGSCRAELDIYQGVPYLISAEGGTTKRTTVSGTSALLQSVPGVGTTMFWANAPGLTAVLMSNGASGPRCAALGSHYNQVRPVPSLPTTTTAVVGPKG